ncbi:MAG: hypothetical protein P8X66_11660, partial [Maritimibacter sp.]
VDGWSVFCSDLLEQMDPQVLDHYAKGASAAGSPTLAVLNADDDFLSFDLYEKGEAVAVFNSCPGAYAEAPSEEEMKPQLRGLDRFAALNAGCNPGALETTFLTPSYMAVDLHADLVRLLGLPDYSIGIGARYLARGECLVPLTDWALLD